MVPVLIIAGAILLLVLILVLLQLPELRRYMKMRAM